MSHLRKAQTAVKHAHLLSPSERLLRSPVLLLQFKLALPFILFALIQVGESFTCHTLATTEQKVLSQARLVVLVTS